MVNKVKTRKSKKYKLTMIFNGLTFNKQTDNVPESIVALTPEVLYTEVYVIVKDNKTKEITDRRLNLIQGKKLFRDETILEIFVNNLMLV